jgi:DnaK suppressor protein
MTKKLALTKSQMDTLRRKLETERKRIVRVLESGSVPSAKDEAFDLEETAQRQTESEDETRVADRERALLAEIDRALGRMDAGTYGISEKSGTPIPYERLRAVPWARQGTDE